MSTNPNSILSQSIRTVLTAGLLMAATSSSAFADVAGAIDSGPITFNASDLIVSSSFYSGTAAPIVAGVTQLPGTTSGQTVTASYDSAYNAVWGNHVGTGTGANADASFGVTSGIYLSNVNTTTGATDSLYNVTAIAASQGINLVTSFSSKSELSIAPSTDGSSISFVGYDTTLGQLDVSNSNTPGLVDPTNPTTGYTASTFRSIASINTSGALSVVDTNAFSGNNGRTAILDNATNTYYIVGNAGNSGTSPTTATLNSLSKDTGVQAISANANNGTLGQTPVANLTTAQINSANSSVVGAGPSANGQYGFDVASTGAKADKTGKDDNFRGEVEYNGTLYVTKGSGSNGVDTVYQVGPTNGIDGLAATGTGAANTISILPGFPSDATKTSGGDFTPFGLWFGNNNTLFVADEGSGNTTDATTNAGLEEWTLSNGTWSLVHTYQTGLIGTSYTLTGTALDGTTGTYDTVTTSGLRELTGVANADGSFTLYATTATNSNSGDNGADPNRLVTITIGADGSVVSNYNVLETAAYGQVLRGVAFAPAAAVPLPPSLLMMLSGLGITGLFARRNKRA